jgi:1-acyl-sn-glycerol-3-phosphate acyltransferase
VSDLFYNVARAIGSTVLSITSRPLVLHRDRVPRVGSFLLASTHLSPFDVPLLIRHSPRKLDFVSIVEVFRNPFIAWFYGSMNAFPLDRSKPDSPTVRIILDRLARQRPVAIFPEGGLRSFDTSVLNGGKMRPGAARLASLAGVPIIPAVVLNGHLYRRVRAWLPLRQVRYGIIYGQPIALRNDLQKVEATAMLENQLRDAFKELYHELVAAMESNGIRVMNR